jgi:serine/threonine protein kinase
MDKPYTQILKQLIVDNNIPRIDDNDVKEIEKIGKGSQSLVFKADYKGTIVAKKKLLQYDMKCIIHELAILSKVEHEHIPKFLGVILNEVKDGESELSYVSSYVQGVPLDEVNMNNLNYETKLKIVKTLSDTISFIHTHNCVHRDIKAENVMLDSNYKLYLIDFGISKVLGEDSAIVTRAKGTINYIPPEVFDLGLTNAEGQIVSKVTPSVDVWGFACLVSYVFSGVVPWQNLNKNPIAVQKFITKKKSFPVPTNIKEQKILDIIQLGTTIDITKRSSMEELNALIQKL